MIVVLVLLCLGIFCGRLIRKKPLTLRLIDNITLWSIYLLLFLMGITIGSNKEIISNLSSLGIKALIITGFSLAGSILLSILVYHFFFRTSEKQETDKP
jgi:uncharacterized membrane protein YbjE (DUF340 family)